MNTMNTNDVKAISREVMAELKAAALKADSDVRDPNEMREACEHMDRIREKNRKLFGEEPIGADIIREMRDSR
ncbi:MAG: hypothetical protein HYR84_04230 [Planctomycetes bacterium]|nr:hypothetical protein [Planctomycetota bacterium]